MFNNVFGRLILTRAVCRSVVMADKPKSYAEALARKLDDRVIDEDNSLQQCGDWEFIVELLGDFLSGEEKKNIEGMEDGIKTNNHKVFFVVFFNYFDLCSIFYVSFSGLASVLLTCVVLAEIRGLCTRDQRRCF